MSGLDRCCHLGESLGECSGLLLVIESLQLLLLLTMGQVYRRGGGKTLPDLRVLLLQTTHSGQQHLLSLGVVVGVGSQLQGEHVVVDQVGVQGLSPVEVYSVVDDGGRVALPDLQGRHGVLLPGLDTGVEDIEVVGYTGLLVEPPVDYHPSILVGHSRVTLPFLGPGPTLLHLMPLSVGHVEVEQVIELHLPLERVAPEEPGLMFDQQHRVAVPGTWSVRPLLVNGLIPPIGLAVEDIEVAHLFGLVVDHPAPEYVDLVLVEE